jgi:hypothetical protein
VSVSRCCFAPVFVRTDATARSRRTRAHTHACVRTHA